MKKTMTASEILSDLGSHKFEILRRDANGAGELHQNWTDVFVVQGGEATIVYGARSRKPVTPGMVRSAGPMSWAENPKEWLQAMVLVMPPGVPHQTLVEPGKSFFTLIVKVQKK